MGLQLSRVACSTHGKSQFLSALNEGRLAEVQELLEDEPGLASYSKPLMGTNALHLAAAVGRADILQALLAALDCSLSSKSPAAAQRARQKVINHRNTHGQTPLHLACKAGASDCVRALLRAGGDPTLFDSLSQSTCLHYAARYGWPGVIDELLGDESWVTNAAGARSLLREAVLVDSQGHHKYVDGRASLGLAPLHWSAAHGHLAATRALIKWGATVTVRCNLFLEDGQGPWVPYSTPLHLCASKGDYATALELLAAWVQHAQRAGAQAGPDPRTIPDFWDRRPCDVARAAGHGALLVVLNPAMTLLPLATAAAPPPAVPRLGALAAAALRRQLAAELDGIAAQQAQQARQQGAAGGCAPEQALAGRAPEGIRCPVCLGEGSAHGACYPAAAALAVARGSQLPPAVLQQQQQQHHQQQQQQQPLLQHGWQLVAARGCGHALCVSCARELCRAGPSGEGAPVRCPMCRSVVGGWQIAPSFSPRK